MAYAGKQSSQLIMSKPLEPRIAVRLGPALSLVRPDPRGVVLRNANLDDLNMK